ncbi:uncharacterized protein RCC_09361 [Ramularia collo-cygni]|uniref:Uncharacterized protein n=1 Tax=Ramularia collo-cygni TaxID=112498 RepID=A0A2D3V013_9PEZI|nr:uncharacterized protein RCC_09361 [Ramularia collo-cygni]CZT23647.1 uncharacterized protein RCC_09361 [Ramularia collo-cygni]
MVRDATNRAKDAKGLPHNAATALLAPPDQKKPAFSRPRERPRKHSAGSKVGGLMRNESEIRIINKTEADKASLRPASSTNSQLPTETDRMASSMTAVNAWRLKNGFLATSEVGEARVDPPATTPAPGALANTDQIPNITIAPPDVMGTADITMTTGESKITGPHPSTIRVSAPYITQSAIEKRLQPLGLDAQERSIAEAREDGFRLQGVTWLDNVRRALQLPIKTYTTACVYYHKFRLAHPTSEYSWSDAAAASLITSCKNEDTLKKSKDILAAAYNLKQASTHEQVGADDPMFDLPSRAVVGVERLVLESGAFDFRSRSPHQTLVKISKSLPPSEDLKGVAQLAWTIMTDLHRTFAPLKQTSATLSLASLELSAHFMAATSENNTCTVRDDLQALNLGTWFTTREEVMETLLDALDLYTHHTNSTILGPKYSLDDFLRIRLALNKECSEAHLPRYTTVQPPPSPDNANGSGSGSTLRVANGHPTPVSPPQPGSQAPQQSTSARSHQATPEDGGTLRFMLNPQRAVDEKAEVNRYYVEEWEEYEEEIHVPDPRHTSMERTERHSLPDRPDRGRDSRSREFDDRRSARPEREPPRVPLAIERERLRTRERDAERERLRLRERDRDRRYDDRRYDDRTGDRRFDDRRDRGDRRHYEEDPRRGGNGSSRDTRR